MVEVTMARNLYKSTAFPFIRGDNGMLKSGRRLHCRPSILPRIRHYARQLEASLQTLTTASNL